MSEQESSSPIVTVVGIAVSSFLFLQHDIPLSNLVFAIGFLTYIILANIVCFRSNELALSLQKEDKPILSLGRGQFRGQPIFATYMKCFQVLTVFLPLVLILLPFGPADKQQLSAPAVPPLFLLVVQIVGENISHKFHNVPRILIPIGFNAYRLASLVAWVEAAYNTYCNKSSGGGGSMNNNNDIILGMSVLVLAMTNLVLWTYNLFGFLLLRVLPVYFDKDDTPHVEMAYTMIPLPKKKKKKAESSW